MLDPKPIDQRQSQLVAREFQINELLLFIAVLMPIVQEFQHILSVVEERVVAHRSNMSQNRSCY